MTNQITNTFTKISQALEIQVKLKLKDIQEAKSISKKPSPSAILKSHTEEVKSMIEKKLKEKWNDDITRRTDLHNHRLDIYYINIHYKILNR